MSTATVPPSAAFIPDGIAAADLYRQLNTAQTAEFLGIPQRNLEHMRQSGKGPLFVRVSPRNVRYRMIDLIRFQEQQLRQSTISNEAPDRPPAA